MNESEIIALLGLWRDVEEWTRKEFPDLKADDVIDSVELAIASREYMPNDTTEDALRLFFGLVQLTTVEEIKLHEAVAARLQQLKAPQ